ncbi:MAG: translocation/assembly module TamB domain-containing protein [Archangiaceae bacterium]|nr:translocation/assembly module TamB domain-containing protein [Archangiaceae bacterium]
MKKWLRRAGIGLLVLLGVLLIGVFAAWQYLTSDSGAERVRGLVLGAAKDSIAGRLEVGKLGLHGGVIVLEQLELYTPEGELVAELERAELHLELGRLLSKNVVLSDAQVDGLRLYLKSDARGLNLNRAIASKTAAAEKDDAGARLHVNVKQLKLQRSYVSWGEGEEAYVLDAIGIDGAAELTVEADALKLKGKLGARGLLKGESDLPLELGVSGDQSKLGVSLKLGEARLAGDFSLDDTSARIAELFVPPQVARRFARDLPLAVPVKVSGEASPRQVALKVEAGKGRATIDATLDGARVPAFALHAEGVDLSELLGQGKPSELKLDAKGRLADPRVESLDAALELSAEWSKVGKLSAKAEAKTGRITLERLHLAVRGATLDAHGSGNLQAVNAVGELEATDLEELAQVVASLTGTAPLEVGGRGQVKLEVGGTLKHPRVKADGQLEALHVSGLSLRGVQFDASLPDAMRPFEAELHAEIARITSGARSFDDVRASLETRGRELTLALSTRGYAELSLTAGGRLDEDGEGLELARLELKYPEATWTLREPAHLSIAHGVEVGPLALMSDDQRLGLMLKSGGGRIDAAVEVVNVELTHLPHAFVPTQWGLGGRLDAKATARGRTASPDAEATVAWRDGSVRTLRGLQLKVQARYSKDRASGTLDGESGIGDLKAKFDVPVKGLSGGKSAEPLSAEVTLDGVVLEALGPLLQTPLPMTGKAALKVEASGTARQPRVTLHAEVKDGVYTLESREGDQRIVVETADLTVQPGDDGALAAMLQAQLFGSTVQVRLATPLTVEGLRAKPPTAASLRALEVQLQADVRHLQLRALQRSGVLTTDYRGAVSLSLSAKGSVDHPEATGTVSLLRLEGARLKPTDLEVTLSSTRADTQVKVAARRAAVRIADLDLRAEAPLETLIDVDKLTDVGFNGHGDIGPFTLDDLLKPNPDEVQPRGSVKASLDLVGTVKDPKVDLRGQLEGVALGKVPLGKANVSYGYEKALSTVGVTLFAGTGTLRARGTVQLDLSQPALMKGVKWEEAPVSAEVDSKGLDLGFLAGATELVPKLEGLLDANATLTGELSEPRFTGHAKWTRGRIAVSGFGEYRDIELEVDGTQSAVTLQKLYAKSGGGWANFKGAATRHGDLWKLQLQGESKDFPIVTDDQLKASATVEMMAEGELGPDHLIFPVVRLPRVVIELPEVKGKDLQDLDRPATIVLVRNGVPVNTQNKKKLAALEKKAVKEETPKRTIRLTIDAPKNLWVKSSDVNAEVGLSEGFLVDATSAVSLSGEVQVKRGRLDVIGRRFDVDASSRVRFSGPPTRAYVNVIATHKNEREGVTVYATVVGTLPQFSIRLTSNPPMSESDIFALVATGRRTLKQNGGSSTISNDQVASVLGAFAASQLKGVLGKKLPLDVLSIEAGSDGLRGTRVEGGKYLTDQVYLGVEGRYGADPKKGENDFAAKLEYQFVPHWSVEAYGGNAAYGADLVWSREY